MHEDPPGRIRGGSSNGGAALGVGPRAGTGVVVEGQAAGGRGVSSSGKVLGLLVSSEMSTPPVLDDTKAIRPLEPVTRSMPSGVPLASGVPTDAAAIIPSTSVRVAALRFSAMRSGPILPWHPAPWDGFLRHFVSR